MRAYFDTSALVPLIINEPTTQRCNEFWDTAELIITSSLSYVEVHAAVAQAGRSGRLTVDDRRLALHAFIERWDDVIEVAPSDAIVKNAATLAETQALRGYDAIHCATALAAASDDFVAVSGDRDLLRAWSALGIPTVDTAR